MKEWVKIVRSPTSGMTTVTGTVMVDNVVGKYGIRCARSEIKQSVRLARQCAIEDVEVARLMIDELEEAA